MNRRTHNPRTAGDLVRIDRRTGCPSAGPTITASRTKRSRRRRARSPTLLLQSTHGLVRGRPAFHLRGASAVIARETRNARKACLRGRSHSPPAPPWADDSFGDIALERIGLRWSQSSLADSPRSKRGLTTLLDRCPRDRPGHPASGPAAAGEGGHPPSEEKCLRAAADR